MVGIERLPAEESPKSPINPELDRHRLVYSKSRVYVNPTAYARDNIPGFVSLVKRVRPDVYFTLLFSELNDHISGGRQSGVFTRLDSRIPIA